MELLFVFSHFRHHNIFPAHSVVHYTWSMSDLVLFVLRVPGLDDGVMLGGKALG